jgi:hypothetical protein
VGRGIIRKLILTKPVMWVETGLNWFTVRSSDGGLLIP